MGRRVVRAGTGRAGRGEVEVQEPETEGALMFERLAMLADRRGGRVVIVAVLLALASGVLGVGVADRLDPYGADDPATESVKGADRLERAGYRETGVVVLVTTSTSIPRPAATASRR